MALVLFQIATHAALAVTAYRTAIVAEPAARPGVALPPWCHQ